MAWKLRSTFTLLNGTDISTPTMHGNAAMRYADGLSYEAAEVPHDGQQLAMLLIVPDEGQFAAVEGALSASTVAQIRDELTVHQVDLALPKSSFRSLVSAKEPVKSLGMVDAFGGAADLSGMNGTGGMTWKRRRRDKPRLRKPPHPFFDKGTGLWVASGRQGEDGCSSLRK